MNLVGNAIKFTDKGSVKIDVSGRVLGENFELRMAVRDTGPGLSEAQAARLFAAFVQADSTVTRRHGGTGLGLAICQRLARMMGGDVALTRSAPGQGSEFTATFTVGRVAGATMLANFHQHAAAGAPVGRSGPASLRGRILLAEDGIDNQRLIALYLTKAGAQVDIAENGRIALNFIDAATEAGWAYELLLTDMQMPEIDGYTLATMLRQRGSRLPIVALTAHAMAVDRLKCMEAGCDDYASKPIDRKALVATCAEWMGRQSGRVSGPSPNGAAVRAAN
jgi:CheY-like chemotaxis protein